MSSIVCLYSTNNKPSWQHWVMPWIMVDSIHDKHIQYNRQTSKCRIIKHLWFMWCNNRSGVVHAEIKVRKRQDAHYACRDELNRQLHIISSLLRVPYDSIHSTVHMGDPTRTGILYRQTSIQCYALWSVKSSSTVNNAWSKLE